MLDLTYRTARTGQGAAPAFLNPPRWVGEGCPLRGSVLARPPLGRAGAPKRRALAAGAPPRTPSPPSPSRYVAAASRSRAKIARARAHFCVHSLAREGTRTYFTG